MYVHCYFISYCLVHKEQLTVYSNGEIIILNWKCLCPCQPFLLSVECTVSDSYTTNDKSSRH